MWSSAAARSWICPTGGESENGMKFSLHPIFTARRTTANSCCRRSSASSCASAAARRYSLPRSEKRSAARLRAEEGDCHAERHGGYNPMCAATARHRGGPDGTRVPNLADYAVLPAGERLVYVTHGHTFNTRHRRRCVRAMCCCTDIAYPGMGAVWQGKPVSEPGFSVHPKMIPHMAI